MGTKPQTSLTGDIGTENAKDTLCRNVTIYGRCRYEDKGNDTKTVVLSSSV